MVTTPDLIERLSAKAMPVRRLRPPLLRAALWLLCAGLILAVLAGAHGVRSDLAEQVADATFVAALGGSFLTGALASIAVFHLSLPDRSRLWLLLPAPPLVLWLATIGYGCLTDWVSIGPAGVRLGSTLDCFATLVVASVPPAVILLMMLRHTARLHPALISVTGGLAIAGVAGGSMLILHELDASVMIRVWNLGAAATIVGLAGTLGRSLLASASLGRIQG